MSREKEPEQELKVVDRRRFTAEGERRRVESDESKQRPGPAAQAQPEVEFGAGTNLLQFPAGAEGKYENHLRLTVKLKAAGVYPPLKVFALRAKHPSAARARLIVVTGSIDASRQFSKVFYTRTAEDFVARECGGDWNAVSSPSSLSNVPDPGCSVDLRPFERTVQEIRDGHYEVERVLN